MILSSSLPGCVVDQVIRRSGHLIIVAHVRRERGRYPDCSAPSSAVHSRYVRHPADLPSFGEAVTLRLMVRRFYCHHPSCRRRTFVEPLPRLLPPRARRTGRLARAQAHVGLSLGGEAGARLSGHLALATSPDTVLRLVHGMTLPPIGPLRAVGIDDWAIRKGQIYGTLLVDLDR
jgi:hypothetical protein